MGIVFFYSKTLGLKTYFILGPLTLVICLRKQYTIIMRKYLIITAVIFLALNSQTLVFAAGSSSKGKSVSSFEELYDGKFNTKDFANLLSDTSFITLEKLLQSPTQKIYNDLTKDLSKANKAKIFEQNIAKAEQKAANDASYAQFLPDAYYKIYQEVLANPNSSTDFNFTKPELTRIIHNHEKKVIELLSESYAFKIEKNNNQDLTLSDFIGKQVNANINLLGQYYKANPSVALYTNQEGPIKINIKHCEAWSSDALHQEMLIKIAALRVIVSNLIHAKGGITYDLTLFDIISIARKSQKETDVHFNNNSLVFNLPKEAYNYIPFGTLKLVNRDAKFMTALQEIEKKKQNPSYDFATKKDLSKPVRGQDYVPAKPSVYESPYGAGSVR